MQISTKFTIAIHALVAIDYFSAQEKVTSESLSRSIGCNPVIVRSLMSNLQKAKLIQTKAGTGGTVLAKPLENITFYDVYEAVEKNKDDLFHFHENPNPACPVGRNIHKVLDQELDSVQLDFENSLKKHNLGEVAKELCQENQTEEK